VTVLLGLWFLSLYGGLHPLGDSLAVFRLFMTLGLALLGLVMLVFRNKEAIGPLFMGTLLSIPHLGPYYGRDEMVGPPDVIVYSKNLLAGVVDVAPVVRDIEAARANLVLLQEVSIHNRRILEALAARFPHQHLCRFSDLNGMALLSRWPMRDEDCSPVRTLATAQIDAPFGRFHAGSVHLLWPYPYNQASILQRAMPMLTKMNGKRVILAGDFNMVPWGYTVRRIAKASGSRQIGPVWNTIDLRGLPLPIDLVLASGTGVSERRQRLGSDHYGLIARISF